MEFRKYWTKVFWNLAKGDVVQYESLRRVDYIKFWYMMDEFEAEIERKRLASINK